MKIKRVYEPPLPADGYRVLVDRLWPRGLSKERAAVNEWLRDIAPTGELRTWFGHELDRWVEFRLRYLRELRVEPAASVVSHLRTLAARQHVTLVYGAQDEVHNQAAVLQALLGASRGKRRAAASGTRS